MLIGSVTSKTHLKNDLKSIKKTIESRYQNALKSRSWADPGRSRAPGRLQAASRLEKPSGHRFRAPWVPLGAAPWVILRGCWWPWRGRVATKLGARGLPKQAVCFDISQHQALKRQRHVSAPPSCPLEHQIRAWH